MLWRQIITILVLTEHQETSASIFKQNLAQINCLTLLYSFKTGLELHVCLLLASEGSSSGASYLPYVPLSGIAQELQKNT